VKLAVAAVTSSTDVSPPAFKVAAVPASRSPVAIDPSATRLIAAPAVSAPLDRFPPALSSTDCAALTLPSVKPVPAAAWKRPVVTGPLMMIDPPVATGLSASTTLGSKLSSSPPPPLSTNIDPSAR